MGDGSCGGQTDAVVTWDGRRRRRGMRSRACGCDALLGDGRGKAGGGGEGAADVGVELLEWWCCGGRRRRRSRRGGRRRRRARTKAGSFERYRPPGGEGVAAWSLLPWSVAVDAEEVAGEGEWRWGSAEVGDDRRWRRWRWLAVQAKMGDGEPERAPENVCVEKKKTRKPCERKRLALKKNY